MVSRELKGKHYQPHQECVATLKGTNPVKNLITVTRDVKACSSRVETAPP